LELGLLQPCYAYYTDAQPSLSGEVIKELCLEPLSLTVTAAAKALGISGTTLSAVLNGHAGVSPEMAIWRVYVGLDS